MADTTTSINGCNAQIYLDDAAGALQEISGSSNKVEGSFENNVGEQSVFGTQWPIRQICGKDAEISINLVMSTADDEGWDLLKNWFWGGDDSARTVRIDPNGSDTGEDRIEGEFVLADFSVPLEARQADPILIAMTLQSTGEVSWEEITS